jgi:hypothetical protein
MRRTRLNKARFERGVIIFLETAPALIDRLSSDDKAN